MIGELRFWVASYVAASRCTLPTTDISCYVAAINILYASRLFDSGGSYSLFIFSCLYMTLISLVAANHVFDCVALARCLWSVF